MLEKECLLEGVKKNSTCVRNSLNTLNFVIAFKISINSDVGGELLPSAPLINTYGYWLLIVLSRK